MPCTGPAAQGIPLAAPSDLDEARVFCSQVMEMVSRQTETSPKSFMCWLCGFIRKSEVGVKSMRDMQCPNCKVKAAFVPRPTIGA